jgi:hypothetical protein
MRQHHPRQRRSTSSYRVSVLHSLGRTSMATNRSIVRATRLLALERDKYIGQALRPRLFSFGRIQRVEHRPLG